MNVGRPKKDKKNKRSVQLRIRVSISELIQLKKRAKELDMSLSGLMRAGGMTYEPVHTK